MSEPGMPETEKAPIGNWIQASGKILAVVLSALVLYFYLFPVFLFFSIRYEWSIIGFFAEGDGEILMTPIDWLWDQSRLYENSLTAIRTLVLGE